MGLEKKPFGTMPDGQAVMLYSLKSAGLEVDVIPYGCRIVRLFAKDKNGKAADVIWGYDSLEGYLVPRDSQGTVVGRYANRIGGAEMRIDDVRYKLAVNEGRNCLHGGVGTGSGFAETLWGVKETRDGPEPSITFTLHSPDGTGGFPGNLNTQVTYTVTADSLRIDYCAVSDKKTALSLTNHSYFNLAGYDSDSVHGHILTIHASSATSLDEAGIPTGEIVPLRGTSYDFSKPKEIGRDIARPGGYNLNYVLKNNGQLQEVADLYEPLSGRVMKTFTDMPGLQLYTADGIAQGKVGKSNTKMVPQGAVCLETQQFPDAVHHDNFPSPWLEADKEFHSTTVYQFSAETR